MQIFGGYEFFFIKEKPVFAGTFKLCPLLGGVRFLGCPLLGGLTVGQKKKGKNSMRSIKQHVLSFCLYVA